MMRLSFSGLVVFVAAACSTPPGPAPNGQVVVSEFDYTMVEAGPGAENCAALPRVLELIEGWSFDDAEIELIVMIEAFRNLEETEGMPLIAFANQAEYEQYLEASGAATAFAPVDWCYKELYQLRAFIHAAREHYREALHSLDRAAEVGPTAAAPYVERGYILNRLGRFAEAHDSYREALKLVSQYPASEPQRPIALRGLGFALIELRDLDAAEEAFLESLEYEPDNALAKNELLYIKRLRADGM